MIQFNYDFFDTLATTGERAVLGVVQTLANKGDLAGLREFMSYSSRNAEALPGLYKLTTMQAQALKSDGESDHVSTNFFKALMAPLGSLTNVDSYWTEKNLSEENLVHAKAILEWASSNPSDNNEALRHASSFLISNVANVQAFEAVEAAWNKTNDSLPAAAFLERALLSMNLVAARHFLPHLTQPDYSEFADLAAHWEVDPKVPTVARAITNLLATHRGSTDAVFGLIESIEAETGVAPLAPMRIHVITALIGNSATTLDDPNDFYSLMKRLHGSTDEHLTTQQNWLIDAANEASSINSSTAEYLVKAIVERNCVELLKLAEPLLADDIRPRLASIGTALQGGFATVSGQQGASRLRNTIEFLQAQGQSLDSVSLDEPGAKSIDMHAMHFLAYELQFTDASVPATSATSSHGSPMEKLAVLLDMGCDPRVKDSRNKMPHQIVHAELKPQWHHTVNAHKARSVAHDVLNEIASGPSP